MLFLILSFGRCAYNIGYQLGKNDSIIAVKDAYNACKNFNSINIKTNKERMCEQGYDKAYNDYLHVNQSNSYLIISKYKHEPAYRVGFAAMTTREQSPRGRTIPAGADVIVGPFKWRPKAPWPVSK